MVGAIVLSLTDAASQEAVVGSAQRVVVRRARAPRDAAVQHCLEYLGSEHPDFELEGTARSVVQFEGVLPEAAPYVAYAPIDLDGQVGIVIGVSPEVVVVVDSRIQPIVLATEETTVTQQVSHKPIKCQSRLWSQRCTKVNGSHRGDNPLLKPTGIQIATKSYATLTA